MYGNEKYYPMEFPTSKSPVLQQGISLKDKLFCDLIVGLSREMIASGGFNTLQNIEGKIIITAKSISDQAYK